jgi:hypothetical protein
MSLIVPYFKSLQTVAPEIEQKGGEREDATSRHNIAESGKLVFENFEKLYRTT